MLCAKGNLNRIPTLGFFKPSFSRSVNLRPSNQNSLRQLRCSSNNHESHNQEQTADDLGAKGKIIHAGSLPRVGIIAIVAAVAGLVVGSHVDAEEAKDSKGDMATKHGQLAAFLEIIQKLITDSRQEKPTPVKPRSGPSQDDKYFMQVAMTTATRSPEPEYQVGCVVTDKDKQKILAVGFNYLLEDAFGCLTSSLKERGFERDIRMATVIHSEASALSILPPKDYEGAVVYVTRIPCHECAKLLVLRKVAEVVYLSYVPGSDIAIDRRVNGIRESQKANHKSALDSYDVSQVILKQGGVRLRPLFPENPAYKTTDQRRMRELVWPSFYSQLEWLAVVRSRELEKSKGVYCVWPSTDKSTILTSDGKPFVIPDPPQKQ